jgi:hypothetical protein
VISLRYHVVSITAVFIALAVGVLLGSSGVSDRLLTAVTVRADDHWPPRSEGPTSSRSASGRPPCAACWRTGRSRW